MKSIIGLFNSRIFSLLVVLIFASNIAFSQKGVDTQTKGFREAEFAQIGALIGDPARANMLTALMGGASPAAAAPLRQQVYEQLRDAIFPNPREAEKNAKLAAVDAKRNFCKAYKTNYDLARASFPFYADDYVKWFAKLNAEPDTNKWRLDERSIFSNWIIDTLALQSEMQETSGKDARAIQRYLNTLKYQFFPMTRPGVTTEKFATPSVESLRRVLFENEVGYKQQNNKVFVKRFYRIPALLFPLDTLLASIIGEKDYAE